MFRPTRFGKYYLTERLAVGGMAEIFKAKLCGVSGFEKPMVVKQILPQYARNAEFIRMFIDEAKIAVSLNHGNIITIYELGCVDGIFFIAMEYVPGKNLAEILDQARSRDQPLSVEHAVFIAIEMCKGLDYAHRRTDASGSSMGVVHRDISPPNVMVSLAGEVKIADFGIAKARRKLAATGTGVIKGTFGYMSPEQIGGEPVDHRTDIFGTGILLHEMLTCRRLFGGPTELDALESARHARVCAPSTINPQVPRELNEVVLKALARSPDHRYADANQLQIALSRILFTQGEGATAKQLAGYMRELFRDELHALVDVGLDFDDADTEELQPTNDTQSYAVRADWEPELFSELTNKGLGGQPHPGLDVGANTTTAAADSTYALPAIAGNGPTATGRDMRQDLGLTPGAGRLESAATTAAGRLPRAAGTGQRSSTPTPQPLVVPQLKIVSASSQPAPDASTADPRAKAVPEATARAAEPRATAGDPAQAVATALAADVETRDALGGNGAHSTPDSSAPAPEPTPMASHEPQTKAPETHANRTMVGFETGAVSDSDEPVDNQATSDPLFASEPARPELQQRSPHFAAPNHRGPRSDESVMAMVLRPPTSDHEPVGGPDSAALSVQDVPSSPYDPHPSTSESARTTEGASAPIRLPVGNRRKRRSSLMTSTMQLFVQGIDDDTEHSVVTVPGLRPTWLGWVVILTFVCCAVGIVIYKKTKLFSPPQDDQALLSLDDIKTLPKEAGPKAGTIEISVTPQDALVLLHVGDTPVDIKHLDMAYPHTLRVERAGYQARDRVVSPAEVKAGARITVVLQPTGAVISPAAPPEVAERRPSGQFGSVRLLSDPPSASVWRVLGKGTVALHKIPVGRYYFKVIHPDYQVSFLSISASQFAESKGTVREKVRLQSTPGTAQPSSTAAASAPSTAKTNSAPHTTTQRKRRPPRARKSRRNRVPPRRPSTRQTRHHHPRKRKGKPSLQVPSWAR